MTMKRGIVFATAGVAMLIGTVACGTPKTAEKAGMDAAKAGEKMADHSCGAAKGKDGCCGADMTHEKMGQGCCGAVAKTGDATCGEGSCGSAPAPK